MKTIANKSNQTQTPIIANRNHSNQLLPRKQINRVAPAGLNYNLAQMSIDANSPIQTKLFVGASNDRFEQEADRIADTVMRMPMSGLSTVTLQRKLSHKKEEREEKKNRVQRKPASNAAIPLNDDISAPIKQIRGNGQSLPESERKFFEPRFKRDFGNVRIHVGTQASQAAKSINARAFTLGNNIVFNQGQYQPETNSGRRLIAHELAHVTQQNDNILRRKEFSDYEDYKTEKKEQSLNRDRMGTKGDWLEEDRENRTSVWNDANLYNTNHLRDKEYSTIEQRQAYYEFVDNYLNNTSTAIKSKFFAAAAMVTKKNSLGAADKDVMNLWVIKDSTEIFSRFVNEFLFKHNMINIKLLMEGKEIPGMEGLRGQELDEAIVEFEQNKVEEAIVIFDKVIHWLKENYPLFNLVPGLNMDDIISEINQATARDWFFITDALMWVGESLGLVEEPSTITKKVFEEQFTQDGKINFDFRNKKHRIRLGKSIMKKLYANKNEKNTDKKGVSNLNKK